MSPRPLDGILVLEFAQYMAAPVAGLRLADLGARVIKIERPGTGDAGRQIQLKNLFVDGDSLVFHTINRNKESFALDLKKPEDRRKVEALIASADVMTHNFRPGVMEKLGLDADAAHRINPRIIYGEVTGFGNQGPWRDRPGQDLLVQSLSGLTWLTGNRDDPPIPFGLAIADMICGAHFAQGIIAALIRRERTGIGATVSVSLLESILDLQFEVLTTHFADGGRLPERSKQYNAHAYLSAPYGIYPTRDGFLALGMGPVGELGRALGCEKLSALDDPASWFERRDEIQQLLAETLSRRTTAQWLEILEPLDIWCAAVFDYEKLTNHEGYKTLQMEQHVHRPDGAAVHTLRCPIRIDGQRLFSDRAAPAVGQENALIDALLRRSPKPSSHCSEPATLPLDNITILDLSQFLSGPCASLRLADLGARVIKVERAGCGDICRELYISDTRIDGESTTFHAINRNKESIAIDLKSADGIALLKKLIGRADVFMHNFRPGVVERLGLDEASLRRIRPDIIYASISGYGADGPWCDKPGQDLLVQAMSGLTWLSGARDSGPVPMGLSVVDQLAGQHLAQGILACLFRRLRTKQGGSVDVSMLESALDFQFEALTTFFQDGGQPIVRSSRNAAHAALGAPYGIYPTADGYLALAMGRIPQLGELLGCPALAAYANPGDWFLKRDEIKQILADHLSGAPTQKWLDILEPADIWCAPVLDWKQLMQSDAYRVLQMEQTVQRRTGTTYRTTRCPITIDGRRLYSKLGSPDLGEHTAKIREEFE